MDDTVLIDSMFNRMNFEVESVTRVRHGKNWMEKSAARYYSIWMITEGSVAVEWDNVIYEAFRGDVFFFAPQRFYTAKCTGDGCSFIKIKFKAFVGKNTRPFSGFDFFGLTKADKMGSAIRYLDLHTTLYEDSAPLAFWAIKADLMLVIRKIYLSRDIEYAARRRGDIEYKTPHLKVEKIISYIVNNIERRITVKELADLMCLSEKYLITYFKTMVGVTPHAYITDIKLRRAFDYLKENRSVKETAQKLGYSDQNTFSRAFKKYYGFPPSSI